MRENLRDMAKKKKMIRGVKNTQTDHPPYLPQEVILENILTRLPFKTLIRWGCVCKLWYNSIYHDPHFASSHFLQSQKNPRLIFNFLNVKYHRQKLLSNYFFSLTEDEKEDYGDGVDILLRSNANLLNCTYKRELVGYCNGLVCLLENMGHLPGNIEIFNPSWLELLWIFRPAFDGRIICYGFGLDSLIKEYKVVLILYTVEKEFKCLVFTLGTNSWRETTSPPPSSRQILRTARPYSKSAAMFCGGALFWRSTKEPNETLLSFDLHNETFQVIQLPADCVSPTSEQQKLVHLLESKGSLCVARLEKILGSDEDHHHHDQISGCKVHLHFLKDEVKHGSRRLLIFFPPVHHTAASTLLLVV